MNLACINSRANIGIQAPPVTIEVHLSKGLPGLSIVGLPEMVVKESRHRVRSAVINSGFEFPVRRITVNLAPADLPKEGGRFDLPIALGILAASGQIPSASLSNYEFAGELALSGEMRPCRGILSFALATRNCGRQLIIPHANAEETTLVKGLTIYGANHLLEVCSHLNEYQRMSALTPPLCENNLPLALDLAQVRGQEHARRALEIAAAGGHSLLMCGPPGSGKTMLASRLPSILPPMSENEAIEVAAVYSSSRLGFNYRYWQQRPFRAPHHTASSAALAGGSNPPAPGEISLAHHGVLFLDELPEFKHSVLDILREPLEAKTITISRAAYQTVFPANFQLVAAMNPCPCGYLGDAKGRCRCTSEHIHRYQQRVSGPLLDRIDMHLVMNTVPANLLMQNNQDCNESSAAVRQRVNASRQYQYQRCQKINAALGNEEISSYCTLQTKAQHLLAQAIETFGLSARTYHRILKVARTIADLENKGTIDINHLQEAISYRCNGTSLIKTVSG